MNIFLADTQCQQCGLLIIKNKHTLYRRKGCMKNFCKSLRGHSRKNVTANKRRNKPHQYTKVC